MRIHCYRRSACGAVLAMLGALPAAPVQESPARETAVSVSIDTRNPGAEIPADFAGLSFETEMLLPGKGGTHYFNASNEALLRTFRNLGIRSLRIGGNTADVPSIPVPGPVDVDSAFAFAGAAGAKVIFTFRLRAGGPQDTAPLARHIMDRYRSQVTCFAIGNEPDVYAKTYPTYRAELKRYMEAFADLGGGAQARFCGPGTTPSKAEWAREFAADFGHSTQIALVTQHAYPGGSGRKVADAAMGRSAMLSTGWVESYERFYQSFVPTVEAQQERYRIEETNSFYNGGAKDVSDTFAAALWGLDYMHWWAIHGAAGINFHTGDRVAAGDESTPCYYAVFLSSGADYAIQPLGYAMKAFDLGGHGRIVPVRVESGVSTLNVTAYAVSAAGTLYLTVINKENGPTARNALVSINLRTAYNRAAIVRLEAPHNDIAAKDGLSLGDSRIEENAVWKGRWQTVEYKRGNGGFVVAIPASSAAILKFTGAGPAQMH